MKFASLFTGCGGLDLGLEQAGHEVILQCEVDPGAQQVLRKHWPSVLLVPDVASLQSLPPETELLTAGFPCIDVSRAGLRAGLQGQSTRLVSHVFRLLERAKADHRPIPWVLLENVEALLDRAHGEPPLVQYVTGRLEALGYHSWAQRVVNSAAFGVPNRRRRVFIVASMHGDARDVLLSQEPGTCLGACRQLYEGKPCYRCHDPDPSQTHNCSFALDLGNARSAAVVDMVPTFTTNNERMCLLLSNGDVGMLRTEDAERLQGFEPRWTEACYPVMQQGVNGHRTNHHWGNKPQEIERRDAARWALIGNAVTVHVARWLGERLMRPYARKYVLGAKDRKLGVEFDPDYQALKDARCKSCSLLFDDSLDALTVDRSTLDADQVQQMYGGEEEEEDGEEGGAVGRPGVAGGSGASAQEHEMAGGGAVDAEGAQLDAALGKVKAVTIGASVALIDNIVTARSSSVAPKRSSAHRDAWPRAAWYVVGIGRHAADGLSEAPVIKPLIPLGEFIQRVGLRPASDMLHTYLQRLREHGFEVNATVEKVLGAGVRLAAEVTGITRLEGGEDRESMGKVVWAMHPQKNVWWPAELLDPFDLPRGRQLPEGCLQELSYEQILAWTPRSNHHQASPPTPRGALTPSPDKELATTGAQGIGSPSVDAGGGPPVTATPAQEQQTGAGVGGGPAGVAEGPGGVTSTTAAEKTVPPAAGASAAEGGPATGPHGVPTGNATTATVSGHRKVLAVFYADRHYRWLSPSAVREFMRFRDDLQIEGQQKLQRRKTGGLSLFNKGVQEATQAALVKAGDATQQGYTQALASHASSKAVAANMQARCGVCEICKTAQSGVPRRCLFNRVAAAAAAGHSGAQLSVRGRGAIGARVSVWWPMDEAFYDGTITEFDPWRHRHSIAYDDGDVELVALWAPHEVVRVLTPPKDWAGMAKNVKAAVRKHRAKRQRQIEQQQQQQQAQQQLGVGGGRGEGGVGGQVDVMQAAHGPSGALPPAAGSGGGLVNGGVSLMSEYEQQRESNIRKNRAKLLELGILPPNTTIDVNDNDNDTDHHNHHNQTGMCTLAYNSIHTATIHTAVTGMQTATTRPRGKKRNRSSTGGYENNSDDDDDVYRPPPPAMRALAATNHHGNTLDTKNQNNNGGNNSNGGNNNGDNDINGNNTHSRTNGYITDGCDTTPPAGAATCDGTLLQKSTTATRAGRVKTKTLNEDELARMAGFVDEEEGGVEGMEGGEHGGEDGREDAVWEAEDAVVMKKSKKGRAVASKAHTKHASASNNISSLTIVPVFAAEGLTRAHRTPRSPVTPRGGKTHTPSMMPFTDADVCLQPGTTTTPQAQKKEAPQGTENTTPQLHERAPVHHQSPPVATPITTPSTHHDNNATMLLCLQCGDGDVQCGIMGNQALPFHRAPCVMCGVLVGKHVSCMSVGERAKVKKGRHDVGFQCFDCIGSCPLV